MSTAGEDSSGNNSVLFRAVPLGAVTQCRVERLQIQGGLAYDLYTEQKEHEQEQQPEQHVLRAARAARSISLFSRYSYELRQGRQDSSAVVGRVESNATGSEFSVLQKDSNDKEGSGWREVCAVVYKRRPRRLGHRRGPRRMAVVVRAVDASGKAAITCDEPLAAMYRQGTAAADAIVVLENKAPKWSSASMAYMLDFGGRVTEASSKNFQLISLDCDSYVAVQFGKTGPDAYALDWRFPVSPLMAFGVAVSIMVRKNMRVL